MVILGIFWLLFAVAAVLPIRWTLYLFFAALSFGSVTVVPGSTTILPYVALAPLLVGKMIFDTRDTAVLWDAMLNPKRLGLLSLFILIAIVVTFTAPFLFAGISVMGLNSPRIVPLVFGTGNLTQPLYLMTSYALCVSFYMVMLTEAGRRSLAVGLLIGATMAVVSGLLDIATAGTAILAPVRTATYAIFEGAMVGDARRVIGFNTEASSFGALTLSFAAILIFIRPAAFVDGPVRHVQTPLALGLIAMAALSTSSAAYLGLALLFAMYALRVALAVLMPASGRERRESAVAVAGLVAVGIAVAVAVMIRPALYDGIARMVDMVLFQKGGSDSFNERSSWNQASMGAFASTGGYGVGVGSTRASSWPVAVLSSTGILGALAMIAFILTCIVRRQPADTPMSRAAIGARYAFVILVIPVSFAGTLVDFGVFMALFFATMPAPTSPIRRYGRR